MARWEILFCRSSKARKSPKLTPLGTKMMTRSRFYRLALDANEQRANVRDVDVLPIPTLDDRATLYLRAVHGNRDFTEEERSNARNVLLNSMAAEIAARLIPAEQSPVGEVPGRKTTHGADRGGLLAKYAAQYWQSVQRKEAIKVATIAKRRTSILALTATFGLVLIVTGGTLGYRWTYPHMADEVTPAAKKADRLGLSLPKPGPAQEAANEAAPEQPVAGQLGPQSVWQQAVPTVQIISQRSEADVLAVFRRLQEEQPSLFGQATLKRINIVGDAKPTEAKPTGEIAVNFGKADPNKPAGKVASTVSAYQYARPPELNLGADSGRAALQRMLKEVQPGDIERMIYTAQVGPFASAKDAVAACQVLQAAADIRCLGFSGLK